MLAGSAQGTKHGGWSLLMYRELCPGPDAYGTRVAISSAGTLLPLLTASVSPLATGIAALLQCCEGRGAACGRCIADRGDTMGRGPFGAEPPGILRAPYRVEQRRAVPRAGAAAVPAGGAPSAVPPPGAAPGQQSQAGHRRFQPRRAEPG